ncbi:hypothetical protein D9619_002811 [Psilocybe cf. subviscida]|uniref:Uncharacterized protein n=1 Tax=Psilocybe cf. subviscida TaxID=2480587 RepID=A0A8H5AXI9_9AGAR|nr:hypothetical protein D9619_002811 [Psilocybe cf. subviscida]
MTESPGCMIQLSGFPVGYFVIKNAASRCVFDVNGDNAKDGRELILYTEKDKTMVESFRNPENNNQVFFIDCSGALCSRSTGHAIDVEGDRIVLRHRRPISFPFPNEHAHPLPRFIYSTETGEISLQFAQDPSYPSPEDNSSTHWEEKTYILTCGGYRRKLGGSSAPKRRSLFGKLVKSVKPSRQSAALSTHSTQRTMQEIDVNETTKDATKPQPELEVWVEVPGSYTSEIRVVTVDTADTAAERSKLSEDAKMRRQWLVIPLKD